MVMGPGRPRYVLKTFLGLIGLFFYCEYLVYYLVQNQCDWPELDPKNKDPSIPGNSEAPVRVMVMADTHLLGARQGHWFDRMRREWQMKRAFRTAIFLHQPELVFVLGDLTDEGQFGSREDFNKYAKRFRRLFAVPEGTKMYVTAGNHDIGFHYVASPYLHHRFVTAFNAPSVQLISVRGNHFVLVNSVALEGDGCHLCKEAELDLQKIERSLHCAKGSVSGEKCKSDTKLDMYSKPILMQHYPLYRESDMECNDFDAAPLPVKQERFRENWECISQEATLQILNQIRPRLALSGHTHHGCTRPLPNGEGIEITIPSFSWRNKNNPNYGLGVFTPNNYAMSKCEMPKESTIFSLYILGCTLFIVWMAYSFIARSKSYYFVKRR